MRALDLFSAAAGGWSLGLHRAGFETVAACEVIEWRRILYAQNNPDVRIYDDVRTLTAERLLCDLGFLPELIVGSPPCQDISSANTKGKGVEGERSGLYFEAIRLVREIRPRWFAFENSANLRTRGADAVLDALEADGYACWPCVVRAGDVGANHDRARSWLIGCDADQVCEGPIQGLFSWSHPLSPRSSASHANGDGRAEERCRGRGGFDLSAPHDPDTCAEDGDAAQDGWRQGRPGRHIEPASRVSVEARGDAARDTPHPDQAGQAGQAGQADGRMVSGIRQAEIADDGCGDGRGHDGSGEREMGRSESFGGDALEPWADWNGGLARHLWLDDGLSAWVAGTRIAIGGRKGTSAASLLVEAFGDAVVPQIPEAIGRAILRVERAMAAIFERQAA